MATRFPDSTRMRVWIQRRGAKPGMVPGNKDKSTIVLSCLQMPTSPRDPSPKSDGREFRVYNGPSLGAAIRHYRREAGLSQVELAELMGLNRTYLSDLEQGKETEQVKRILQVLKRLGVRMTLQKADW